MVSHVFILKCSYTVCHVYSHIKLFVDICICIYDNINFIRNFIRVKSITTPEPMYKASLTHVDRGLQHVQSVGECEGWSDFSVTLVTLYLTDHLSNAGSVP